MARKRLDPVELNRPTPQKARRRLGIVLGSLFVVAVCVAVRCYDDAKPANADQVAGSSLKVTSAPARKAEAPGRETPKTAPRASTADKEAAPPPAAIVATVNNQRITRKELAQECRRNHGKDVLESMVNKHLIVQECRRRGISVTRDEVEAEINRMAKRFSIPVDQWLKMLKQERNITPEQYADDIIWPTLALRKIAGEKLTISRDELIREFEIDYGEAVRARLIAVSDLEKAKKLREQAAANPDDFGNLAKDYSEDAPSASLKGVINPIRKHGSYKEIEEAVFDQLADGEVSEVIHAGGQYVILKREGLIPARQVKFEEVAPKLEEIIRDRKMQSVGKEIFRELQQNAKVENVWNNPALHQKMPDVAALINGQPITIKELDEECIARHGLETLDGLINRKILEQACQRRGIAITEKDMEKEIARAALAGVRPKDDGSPDVEAWLDLVVNKQGIPLESYRNDLVWPSVAMRKLVGDKVEVTEEDLQKGFEANYGPRVRCLAIVLGDQRRAQQVFEMARKNNTSEYFGDLASQYSIEPGSQAMRGEVPPIKKFGGQPQIEKEAFSLKPGEISGIIQVGNKFVILRCEGYTKPTSNITFEQVRDEIRTNLHEKKLQLAMTEYYEDLRQSAAIDNYLAGTSQSPKQESGPAPVGSIPSLRQVPGK